MSTTSLRLLSAIRRQKSRNHLYSTPENYFDDGERRAVAFIRHFIETHNRWPSAATVETETGVPLVIPKEPLTYYLEDARKRALYLALSEPYKLITEAIQDQNPDEVIQTMRECILMASAIGATQSSNLVSYKDSIDMVVDDYDLAKHMIGLRGVPTGYPFLDEAFEGLQQENTYGIIGRPGRGKSQKALRIAKAARDAGRSVLFLSMEMGTLQLSRRMFGMDTKIDTKFLRAGRLSTMVEREMRRQKEILQDSDMPPFYWLAGNFKKSADALEAAIWEVEPDVVIADAAYLMKKNDRTKFNQKHELLSDVMEDLADLFIRSKRAGLLTMQFNRTASGKAKSEEGDTGSNTAQRNPLAHLDLSKISGTDAVGQILAGIVGIDKVEPPHDQDQRYAGLLKSREGEDFGWYKWNYSFRPPNFDQIADYRQYQRGIEVARPDLSYMDIEA